MRGLFGTFQDIVYNIDQIVQYVYKIAPLLKDTC